MQSKTKAQDGRSTWPADGLESVPSCPVCGAGNRELLHDGLTDKIFFCAPGTWSMYRCLSCASAYLDPRPNLETIGLAYQHYFTHREDAAFSSLSFFKRFRRSLANGYRNYHYGTRDYPASILGVLAVTLVPNGRTNVASEMRHLPKEHAGKRLLDMGCGNGEFLLRARSAGWTVVGVDFDPKAVEVASSQGLDIRLGSVQELDPTAEQFDVITLAHVIEHVHQPIEILKACYRLLKPGGILWLETPNMASEGHRLFGENWRGLEPPRHLVLFTLESMNSAMRNAGFAEVKILPYRPLCKDIFGASKAIEEGVDPYSELRRDGPPRMVKIAERVAKRDPSRREFITVQAVKSENVFE